MTPETRAELRAAIDRRRRELEGIAPADVPSTPTGKVARFRHGTASGYRTGCRCDPCREATNAARRRRRPAPA